MEKIILIDADNTIYSITNKDIAYDAMLSYVAKILGTSYESIKKRFYDIVSLKRSSLRPEDHKRDVPLRILGLKESEIKKALDIFMERILSGLVLNPGIEDFLEFCVENDFKVFVFSDEFKELLHIKLSHSLGKEYERYFSGYITSDLTGCMKPCEKYYTSVSRFGYLIEDISLVIGDDYHRDLEIAKDKLFLRVALYTSQPITNCAADFCFSDFKEVINFLKKKE